MTIQLFTVEYIPAPHNLYMLIPISRIHRAAYPDHEFLFSSYLDAKAFIDLWQLDPAKAMYAYDRRENADLLRLHLESAKLYEDIEDEDYYPNEVITPIFDFAP